VIEVAPKKELGEKYAATIVKVEEVDGFREGTIQMKVTLKEHPSGSTESVYLPLPATERNRTGRILTALNGTYPEGQYDEQLMVGMTVSMIYKEKTIGANKGDLGLDLLKPRDKAKGEDPEALVAEMLLKDADIASDPF